MGDQKFGISPEMLVHYASQIKGLVEKGIEVARQLVADTVSFSRRRVQKTGVETNVLLEEEGLEGARLARTIGPSTVPGTTLHGEGLV